MVPPNRISFDRIAHRYDETRGLPSDQMEAILDILVPELSRHQLILEVGIGTGRFALPLRRRGVQVLGIDLSRRMVARGLAKGLHDVFFGDALHLPFRDGGVDAAYSVHVLHLIKGWQEALREINRVARDSYYTIATYHEGDSSPYRSYWEFLTEEGFEKLRPGRAERDLPEVIPPSARRVVGSFEETYEVADALKELEDRIFSGQWNLPESAHDRALKRTREQFPLGRRVSKRRIEILRWDIDSLASALSSIG